MRTNLPNSAHPNVRGQKMPKNANVICERPLILIIYKKGSICFNIQFFMDKMKKVKKNGKKFDPPPLGFEPQIF